MITRKEKWLWGISAVMLILLFLASSTDLLIKEEKMKIYPISVIINDVTDDYYVNFRKGADQAAMEMNADVRFITLYDAGSWEQQKELILREVRDGAEALVVEPIDAKAAVITAAMQRIRIPIVYLNGMENEAEEDGAGNLSFDFYDLGRQTGEAVLRNHAGAVPVCLLETQQEDEVSSRFRDGVLSVLESAGGVVTWHHWNEENEGSLKSELGKMTDRGRTSVAVVALDPRSLLKTADILADSSAGISAIVGLYGRGTTIPILKHLEQGRITGLCITDDFTAGYLSVKMAADQIDHRKREKAPVLKSAYIEREGLRQAEYEKMLYPIE